MKGVKMTKYSFTGETKDFYGVILKRIKRNSDGLVGGWIESEKNLSQSGDCFVFGSAQVSGDAQVYGNARVSGSALVYGNAEVYGNAQVSGNARVYGNAEVYGIALVSGSTLVYGNARVYGNALVSGSALVYGNAEVYGNALVSGNSTVKDKKCINVTNLKHNITITDKHIQIGCELHTIKHWSKNIKEIGKNNGYTEEEIKGTILIIKGCLKVRKGLK